VCAYPVRTPCVAEAEYATLLKPWGSDPPSFLRKFHSVPVLLWLCYRNAIPWIACLKGHPGGTTCAAQSIKQAPVALRVLRCTMRTASPLTLRSAGCVMRAAGSTNGSLRIWWRRRCRQPKQRWLRATCECLHLEAAVVAHTLPLESTTWGCWKAHMHPVCSSKHLHNLASLLHAYKSVGLLFSFLA